MSKRDEQYDSDDGFVMKDEGCSDSDEEWTPSEDSGEENEVLPPRKRQKRAASVTCESFEEDSGDAEGSPDSSSDCDGTENDDDAVISPLHNRSAVKAFLTSKHPWKTTVGNNLYNFTISPLLQIGRTSNEGTNRKLYDYFFTETGIPTGRVVTCTRVKYSTNKCDACQICRDLSYHANGLDWKLGRFCKDRVEAITMIADTIHHLRAEQAEGLRSRDWYKRVSRDLFQLGLTVETALRSGRRL